MIPDDFIRDLRDRADIVDVIDRRVPLKKQGKDFWALSTARAGNRRSA